MSKLTRLGGVPGGQDIAHLSEGDFLLADFGHRPWFRRSWGNGSRWILGRRRAGTRRPARGMERPPTEASLLTFRDVDQRRNQHQRESDNHPSSETGYPEAHRWQFSEGDLWRKNMKDQDLAKTKILAMKSANELWALYEKIRAILVKNWTLKSIS
jgi:hypothetical protein